MTFLFGAVAYLYDGDGRRVGKAPISQPTQPYKLYWYGAGSDPLLETDQRGNLQNEYIFFGGKRLARRDAGGNVNFYLSDHLGSSRVVTDAVGTITPLDDCDFTPFGQERCYQDSSTNRYKFTGKERDTESGLDNFGARYFGSTLGRFLSPDWSEMPEAVPYAEFADPQSLNLYSYVRNNPLSRTDPNGHWCLYGMLGTTCENPEPAPPPPPPPPPEGAPGTPTYDLVKAQDAARADPAFEPQGQRGTRETRTFCNLATCSIVGETGAPLNPLVDSSGVPTNANTSAASLEASTQYREVTAVEAQQYANQGMTVIVGYKNPAGSGHLATVRPDNTYFAPYELMGGRTGPVINQIGGFTGIYKASRVFRPTAEVKYYVPR